MILVIAGFWSKKELPTGEGVCLFCPGHWCASYKTILCFYSVGTKGTNNEISLVQTYHVMWFLMDDRYADYVWCIFGFHCAQRGKVTFLSRSFSLRNNTEKESSAEVIVCKISLSRTLPIYYVGYNKYMYIIYTSISRWLDYWSQVKQPGSSRDWNRLLLEELVNIATANMYVGKRQAE